MAPVDENTTQPETTEVKKPVAEAKKKRSSAAKKSPTTKKATKKLPVAKKATATKNKKKSPTTKKSTKKPAAVKKAPKAPKVAKTPKSAAPKKPLTGFAKFRQEHLAKVKEEFAGESAGQIGKRLGDMWRALSKEQKAAYKPVKEVVAVPVVKPVVAAAAPILAA